MERTFVRRETFSLSSSSNILLHWSVLLKQPEYVYYISTYCIHYILYITFIYIYIIYHMEHAAYTRCTRIKRSMQRVHSCIRHIYIHIHMCVCIYIYIHVHLHIHTYIYTCNLLIIRNEARGCGLVSKSIFNCGSLLFQRPWEVLRISGSGLHLLASRRQRNALLQ